MRAIIGAIAMLGVASTAAIAGEKKAETKDPNRVICEKQQVMGSRLASKRVCMTAAEWQAKRLEERLSIDKAQTQRGTSGN
ncbi:MAG TPA: hypothetical protein VGD23_06200 [Sphingomicrobium sp.]